MEESSQHSIKKHAEQDDCIYEIYAYHKCPETNMSPWQKVSSDRRAWSAQAMANELFKTELYEKIEIQQKPINSNCCQSKIVKTYSRNPLTRFINKVIKKCN